MSQFDPASPPKGRLGRLPGETMPLIGHNQGPPLDPGRSGRVHAWRKARAELMPRLPIEILRRRVARAKALGLAYPDYASILLGTGRDVVGFLFTCQAIGARLERGELRGLDADRAERLRALAADRLMLADAAIAPERLAAGLASKAVPVAGVGPAPATLATWREGREAVLAVLRPLRLPSDAVVMVGTEAAERDWADAARTAAFLSAERYFAERAG